MQSKLKETLDNLENSLKEWNSQFEKLNKKSNLIKDLKNQIEKLQQQLIEANKLIKDFHEMHEFNKSVIEYLEKWGVK